MFLLYRILTFIIYPILILLTFYRKLIKKEHPDRYKEKIFLSNFNVNRQKNKRLFWFHAVSIGEMKSITPVLRELNKQRNNIEFLITTTTLSSSDLIIEEFKEFKNVQHRFFPFDVNFLVKNFLKLWKPDTIFFIDSEIWPNLILNAKKNKIPMIILNGRITQKTFNKWVMISSFSKKLFNYFDLCLCSNLETKNFLLSLNAKNVFYTGNIKLARSVTNQKVNLDNQKILGDLRFWIAASTHEPEEIMCLKTHQLLKKKFEKITTIIAPRHINRTRKIYELCSKMGLKTQILEKEGTLDVTKEIIIINSFGLLSVFFMEAKSVFIGKSTVKNLESVGGQNPIDAANFGCKIYHGNYVYNFQEIYDFLKLNKISEEIDGYNSLANKLINDLSSVVSKKDKFSSVMRDLEKKTLSDTMNHLNKFLFNEI